MTKEEYDKRADEIKNLIADYKLNTADCVLQIAMNKKSIVALEIEREKICDEFVRSAKKKK